MWYRIAKKKLKDPKTFDGYGARDISGIPVFIEYPKGSTRTKTGKDGKTWSRKMEADYGRISKTEGNDGDCVDVFVGTLPHAQNAYIVNQVDEDGNFDEHKCVLQCESEAEARDLYLANYPKNWKAGKITTMSIPELKKWLKKVDKSKPA